jgi:hypothetical protein
MESLENTSKSATGFFKHVFQLDDDSKGDLLNIVQYSTLSIVPIVLVNKLMQKYVPEANDEKGSLEIVAEVLLQIFGMFISLFFIHRIVTFAPTYSGIKYPDFSVNFIVLSMLMITLSLQTKLGDKVTILVDRLVELWNGKSDEKDKGKGKGKGKGSVKVSQPLSQSGNQGAMNQSLYSGGGGGGGDGQSTSISSLPPQIPEYNNMYRNDANPMVNAATPGLGQFDQGPMPASEAFGGSMFGGSMF